MSFLQVNLGKNKLIFEANKRASLVLLEGGNHVTIAVRRSEIIRVKLYQINLTLFLCVNNYYNVYRRVMYNVKLIGYYIG